MAEPSRRGRRVALPGDRFGDHLFDHAGAVHFSGIDVGEALVDASPNGIDRHRPVVALHLPGPLADDSHAAGCGTERLRLARPGAS